jgi:hypothetical protein
MTSKLVFWVLTPCGLVGRYQRFGGTYYLHLQTFVAIYNTNPHDVTKQTTNIDIFTAVRTSYLI